MSKLNQRANRQRRKSEFGTSHGDLNAPNKLTMEQVFQYAIKAGFSPQVGDLGSNPTFPAVEITALAYAESSLDAHAMNTNSDGSIDVGLAQINSIHQPPSIDRASWVRQMKDPLQNMKAAYSVSGHGANWEPWVQYRSAAYQTGRQLALKILAKYHNDPSTLDALGAVTDISNLAGLNDFGVDVFGWVVGQAAKKAGELFFGASLWVVKEGIWGGLIQPRWGHIQRATVYYYNEVMTGKTPAGERRKNTAWHRPYAGVVTIGFWAIGYALLWRDAETGAAAASADRTPLGSVVRSGERLAARRKVYAPKDAKNEIEKKPKAKPSAGNVEEKRRVSVRRKRAVIVTGQPKGEGSNGDSGRESDTSRTGARRKRRDEGGKENDDELAAKRAAKEDTEKATAENG